MSNPLITVIIPIYNVERYLKRCIESVICQDYENLEIILVDDGATDASGQIADDYAEKDKRIKVIHQKNGGLSNARNNGLKAMTGQYVMFVDSDDYIAKDYVSYMYYLLKKTNFKAQLAVCSLIDVYGDSGRKQDCGNGTEKILSGKQCIEMMCYHNLVDTCAYAKLGSRELYDGFEFPEGKLFEDIGSTYKLFLKAKEVSCGFKGKYYYIIRPNSIVTSSFNESKLDLLEMTDKMANDVLSVYPDLADAVERRQVYARFSTLNQMLHASGVESIRQKLIRYIKDHHQVLFNAKAPRRDKVAYQILRLGFPIYRLAWLQYEKRKGK